LLPIVQQSGKIMDKAETVTLFNDMCLMAPATLIDKRIQFSIMPKVTMLLTQYEAALASTSDAWELV
jgi:hypothetical protein